MTLTLFNSNSIEIVVNTRTGAAFTTQNGYTKLSGKSKQTIADRLSRSVATGQVKKDEAVTVFGVKTFKLIPAKLTLDWLELDRPDLAAEVSDPTAYLHQLAGYTQPVKAKRQRKAKAVEGAPIMGIPIMAEPVAKLVRSEDTKSVETVAVPEVEVVRSNRTTPGLPSVATDLTVLDFSGKRIRFERRGDRMWVNLTDMAKAADKQVNDYTRSKSATEFLKEFESITGIPVIESKVGGAGIPEIERGTWAIEEVAIDFAAWCNTSFRIWVAQQIRTLMTVGTVTIAKPEPTPPPAPQMQLPPCDIRVVNLINSLKESDFEMKNPRLKSGLHDIIANTLGLTQKALPGGKNPATSVGVWCGVVERAEQLGYPVGLVLNKRSQLGKWVAERVTGSVKENRYCNKTEREINVYPVNDNLDAAIRSYFDRLSKN